MQTIWFIRHGESESNRGMVTPRNATSPLTALGQQQSVHVAKAFPAPPELVITSPYIRTGMTAAPTIARFAPSASLTNVEWPVQEFTFLAADRTANTVLKQRLPMAEQYWQRCEPHYIDGEGAESFANLIGRIQAMFERLRDRPESFIAVFTHGQFLRAMVWHYLVGEIAIDADAMRSFRLFDQSIPVPNAAILKMTLDGNDRRMSNFITAHLLPVELAPDLPVAVGDQVNAS
jgi:broad specificity phosphatase PhoE